LTNGKLRTSFCTYAVRAALLQKVGGFREFFSSSYDIDFQLRLSEITRVAYVPQNWYYYRLHPGSITHNQPSALREFLERTAFEMQHQRQLFGTDDLKKGCPPLKPKPDGQFALSATEHIQGQLLGRAWREHRAGAKGKALRTGVRAVATK